MQHHIYIYICSYMFFVHGSLMHLIVQTWAFPPQAAISIVVNHRPNAASIWLIFDGSWRFGLKILREGCLQSGGSPMVSSSLGPLGSWSPHGTDWVICFRKPSRKLLTMENIYNSHHIVTSEFVLFFFANNPWNQTDLYLREWSLFAGVNRERRRCNKVFQWTKISTGGSFD